MAAVKEGGNESVLVDVFGEDPFIKIVDTLMDHPNASYTKTDLAEVNDISRSTVYNVWDRIDRLGIVRADRTIGNTTLYTLNRDAAVVRAFYAFEQTVQDAAEGDTPG